MTAKELQEEADKKAKKSKGKDGNGNKSPKVIFSQLTIQSNVLL